MKQNKVKMKVVKKIKPKQNFNQKNLQIASRLPCRIGEKVETP